MFYVIRYIKNIQVNNKIRLPNNLYKFYIFFHLKVQLLVYSIYPFQFLDYEPNL